MSSSGTLTWNSPLNFNASLILIAYNCSFSNKPIIILLYPSPQGVQCLARPLEEHTLASGPPLPSTALSCVIIASSSPALLEILIIVEKPHSSTGGTILTGLFAPPCLSVQVRRASNNYYKPYITFKMKGIYNNNSVR